MADMDDLLDVGTPPKPQRHSVMGKKKARKPPQATVQQLERANSRLERRQGKGQWQKQRLEARAFKEVDAFMEALGVPVEAPGPGSFRIATSASNRSFTSVASIDGLAAALSSPAPRSVSSSGTPQESLMRLSSGLSCGEGDAGQVELQLQVQSTGGEALQASDGVQRQPPAVQRVRTVWGTPTSSQSGSEAPPAAASTSFAKRGLRSPSWLEVTTASLRASGSDAAALSTPPRSPGGSRADTKAKGSGRLRHDGSFKQLQQQQQQQQQQHSPSSATRRSTSVGHGLSGGSSASGARSPSQSSAHRRSMSGDRPSSTATAAAAAAAVADGLAPRLAQKERLVAARAVWQTHLSDVLDGKLTLDDVEGLYSECMSKAEDLRGQMIVLETPPSGWRDIEDRLDWLQDCVRQARGVLRDLEPHKHLLQRNTRSEAADRETGSPGAAAAGGVSIGSSGSSGSRWLASQGSGGAQGQPFEDVRMVMVPDMIASVQIFASSVCDSLARVQTEEEVRTGAKAANKVLAVAKLIARDLFRDPCNRAASATLSALSKRLGEHAAAVAAAAMDASVSLCTLLLDAPSLHKDSFAHETSRRSKALQAVWRTAAELVGRVGRQWEETKLQLNRQLLNCMLHAANCALDMHEVWLPPDGDDEEAEDMVGTSGMTGAWGAPALRSLGVVSPTVSRPASPGHAAHAGYSGNLGDEDVQAHAWVPTMLLSLLSRAHVLHRGLREELSNDALTRRVSADEEEVLYELLDKLQETFSHLAIASTRRTALLCSRPQPLSYWALEILKDQAEQALKLVQKWDNSTLGLADLLGDESLQDGDAASLFYSLKLATEQVSNGLLRVRRLLKLRRADEDQEMHGLPRVRFPQQQQAQPQHGHRQQQTQGQGQAHRQGHGLGAGHGAEPGPSGQTHNPSQLHSPQQQQQQQQQQQHHGGARASQGGSKRSSLDLSSVGPAGARRDGPAPAAPTATAARGPAAIAPRGEATAAGPLGKPSEGAAPPAALVRGSGPSSSRAPLGPPASIQAPGPMAALQGPLTAPAPPASGSSAASSVSIMSSSKATPSNNKSAARPAAPGPAENGHGAALPEGAAAAAAAGPPSRDSSVASGSSFLDVVRQGMRQGQAGPAPGSPAKKAGPARQPGGISRQLAAAGVAETANGAPPQPGGKSSLNRRSDSGRSTSSAGQDVGSLGSQAGRQVVPEPARGPAPPQGQQQGHRSQHKQQQQQQGKQQQQQQQQQRQQQQPRPGQAPMHNAHQAPSTRHQQPGSAAPRAVPPPPPTAPLAAPAKRLSAFLDMSCAAAACLVDLDVFPPIVSAHDTSSPAPASIAAAAAANVPPAGPPLPSHCAPTLAIAPPAWAPAPMSPPFTSPSCAAGAATPDALSGMPSLDRHHRPGISASPAPTQAAVQVEFAGPAGNAGARTPVLFACSPAQPSGYYFAQAKLGANAAAATQAAAAAAAAAVAATAGTAPAAVAAAPAVPQALSSASSPPPLNQQGSLDGHWALGHGVCRVPSATLKYVASYTNSPEPKAAGATAGPAAAAAANGVAKPRSLSTSPFAAAAAAATAAADPPPRMAASPPAAPSSPAAAASSASSTVSSFFRQLSSSEPAANVDRFWNVRWHELQSELVALIGSGSFGQVWHAMFHHDEVAVKVISIDRDQDFDADAMDRFKQEVDIQRRLSHTNIVQFRGACCEYADSGAGSTARSGTLAEYDSSGSGLVQSVSYNRPQPMLAIVMEYCRLGNLFKMIGKARHVQVSLRQGAQTDMRVMRTYSYQFYSSWERRLEVAYGTAAGLEFMHHNGVVHRDLTSYNILLDWGRLPGTWVAKLCDFNLSRVVPAEQILAKSQGLANSPAWQSPELLDGGHYGFPNDVFAFGVVLWEICTLQVPWEQDEGDSDSTADRTGMVKIVEVMGKVIAGKRLDFPLPSEIQPPLPEAEQLIELACRCWAQVPSERPLMSEVADALKLMLEAVKRRGREARATAQRAGQQ